MGPEFHADASFWRLLVEGGLGSPTGRLSAPLYRSFLQPPTFTFEVRRLGRCHGGYFLGPEPGSGVWWRFEFDDDVRARLRATVGDWNDLSINVLELLGMVVTAWIFITQSSAHIVVKLKTPPHAGPGLAAQNKNPPMASPEASDHKVNVDGCKRLRFEGAERRPGGDPNPPSTNRRQNAASAWNSGPKWIHGDDAARVCGAWYFALYARAGGKPTWLSIRRTKCFPGRTTSHKCNN